MEVEGERSLTIQVPGGPTLEGRLASPTGARAGVVACHPHPLYGGDMDNPVVIRVVEVAREAGLSTLRFNFRGVGASTGVHGDGEGEQTDLQAALAALKTRLPQGQAFGIAGYSFGAWIAASVAASTAGVAGLALIAPPLAMRDVCPLDTWRGDLLLVAGTRDSYCPVERLEALAARVPGARAITLEGADHFFFGKLFPLGEAIRDWARRWTPR